MWTLTSCLLLAAMAASVWQQSMAWGVVAFLCQWEWLGCEAVRTLASGGSMKLEEAHLPGAFHSVSAHETLRSAADSEFRLVFFSFLFPCVCVCVCVF